MFIPGPVELVLIVLGVLAILLAVVFLGVVVWRALTSD